MRVTRNELRRVLNEAIKNILNEETKLKRTYYNYDYSGYHWSISKASYPELEALNCEDESSKGYKTPEKAYDYGLKHLKKYKDGDFMLEIYHWDDDSDKCTYDSGYLAVIHDGEIEEYC